MADPSPMVMTSTPWNINAYFQHLRDMEDQGVLECFTIGSHMMPTHNPATVDEFANWFTNFMPPPPQLPLPIPQPGPEPNPDPQPPPPPTTTTTATSAPVDNQPTRLHQEHTEMSKNVAPIQVKRRRKRTRSNLNTDLYAGGDGLVDYKVKRKKLETEIAWIKQELQERESELRHLDILESSCHTLPKNFGQEVRTTTEAMPMDTRPIPMATSEMPETAAAITDPRKDTQVIAFTSGYCGDDGSGIGIYFGPDNERNVSERTEHNLSRKLSEICAIIKLLQMTSPSVDLEIRTSSSYIHTCATKRINGWNERKWPRTCLNSSLWRQVHKLCTGRTAKTTWTKVEPFGESYNIRALNLALQGSRKPKVIGDDTTPPNEAFPMKL